MAAAAVIIAAADNYDYNKNNPNTAAALTRRVEKHNFHLGCKKTLLIKSRWASKGVLRELFTSFIYYERLSYYVTAAADTGPAAFHEKNADVCDILQPCLLVD